MNKKILQLIIGGVSAIAILSVVILLVKKKIDVITFLLIFGGAILLFVVFNILINYIKSSNTLPIKEEPLNYVKIKQDLRDYIMINKFIQPINEEVRFNNYNKEIYAIYFCEDDNSHKFYYLVYNINKKLYSEFSNKKELLNYLNDLNKSQYVIKQKTIGRNTFTGEEREVEESIDKEEMKALLELKKDKEEENRLK